MTPTRKLLLASTAAFIAFSGTSAFADMDGAKQKRGFEAMFESADTNKDSMISEAEFLENQKQNFAKLDQNGDGNVTLDEAKAMRKMRHQGYEEKREGGKGYEKHGSNENRMGKREIKLGDFQSKRNDRFEKLDANQDGVISSEEIKARSDERSQRMQARLLNRYDTDNSGDIAKAEYEAATLAQFAKMDANEDGTVDRSEMRAMRKEMRGDKYDRKSE